MNLDELGSSQGGKPIKCQTSEIVDLWRYCAPVPQNGPGICSICHGFVNKHRKLCSSCARLSLQLSGKLAPVIPITLCCAQPPATSNSDPSFVDNSTLPSDCLRSDNGDASLDLYSVMRYFKWHASSRRLLPYREYLARLLVEFISRHSACIASCLGGPWDTVTHVPSSKARQGTHPLEAVTEISSLLKIRCRRLLGPGSATLSHCVADPDGYRVTEDVVGRRVLLVDDTYASGARAQSAAASLETAGALTVAIVPIVRLVDPGFSLGHGDFWVRVSSDRFSMDSCCLEEEIPRSSLSA